MSLSDLQRVIQRATPRVEDVRSPDRTDFIRRNHGHFNLRETVEALDALEFSADAFMVRMRELIGQDGGCTKGEAETAVHVLFRVLNGLRVLLPAIPGEGPPTCVSAEGDSTPASEPADGWQEVVAAARSRGAECFKQKDFRKAVEEYSAAIAAAPASAEDLHTLYSNRSAALLSLGDNAAALADAQRCVELMPTWPKGWFRKGKGLRALGYFNEAVVAFREGHRLEPENKDWEKEVETTEKTQRTSKPGLVHQLLWHLLPDLLRAWVRGGAESGVLQLQVKGDIKDLGTPKWVLNRAGQEVSKSQIRFAFLSRKEYLANLAGNIQNPPEGVAAADLEGKPLKIPEIISFLDDAATKGPSAVVHLDVQNGSSMAGVICRMPCDEEVRRFLPPLQDPPPPKGAVDGVLQLQKKSGFHKALPRFLGFQTFTGDLNFPVIDLERDAPDTAVGSS